LGYAYYAEIPAVIFNIQRCGPSTGMPTRTQQSDLLLCAYASHGDTKHILLLPESPKECFEFALEAFDLADELQTPVMVLSDLEIGMNEYYSPPLSLPKDYKPRRGKLLRAHDIEARSTPFFRYLDEDHDGIPYRSLPGDSKAGAYFTRGSGHDAWGRYTEDSQLYQDNMDRMARKLAQAREHKLPKPVIHHHPQGGALGVIFFGSSGEAIYEALDLCAQAGTPFSHMRLRSFPFSSEVIAFIEAYPQCVVIEQNRDAQMRTLLVQELPIDGRRLRSITHYGGLPLEARFVQDSLQQMKTG
jgi:2-oxoglutarate ferredoxin oxidoreductase subunit alpha